MLINLVSVNFLILKNLTDPVFWIAFYTSNENSAFPVNKKKSNFPEEKKTIPSVSFYITFYLFTLLSAVFNIKRVSIK